MGDPAFWVTVLTMQKIIDTHIHGIKGYDTRTTDVEHILKIAEIQDSYGISEIIATIYPATIRVMRENMAVIRKAMELQKTEVRATPKNQIHCYPKKSSTLPPPKVFDFLGTPFEEPPLGNLSRRQESKVEIQNNASRIIGVHLEGPFLNPSKCGALNAMTFIEPTEYNLKELIEGFEDIIKIITIAPEINGATKLIKTMTDMGIIASMGHSNATYAEAEAGFHAGAKGITHIFNAMREFHHRDPGIAGFGLLNKDIYIEVIADPFHLHQKTLELIFKTKKHDKIILVSDMVRETKTSSKNAKVTDFHGKLLGGSMTITESSKRLIEMGFDKDVIMKCITENPERYLRQ